MKPLRVCFLWHQHQPDYRKGDGFFLPWVRMHAIKDYVDLLEIMAEHPVKHTVNLVPSMLMQLDEYAKGRKDPVQRLCEISPDTLSREQRLELFSWVRTLQFETMVQPLPRLAELWETEDPASLGNQDVLDLQVLLHLAWCGPRTRQEPLVSELISKGRDYTQEERDQLFSLLEARMNMVVPAMKDLVERTGSEVSVTPFHHPILPLIIDSMHRVKPRRKLRSRTKRSRQEDDAEWHVRQAIADHDARFGSRPFGMWPAEGSLSMKALAIMASHQIRWVATDEAVLQHSLGDAMDRDIPLSTISGEDCTRTDLDPLP